MEHCLPNKLPEIITVLEKTPNYEMDVSSAIKDMIGREGMTEDKSAADIDLDGFSMKSEQENGAAKDGGDADDDDDDYVVV